MLFTRAKAKSLVQDTIAESPITILAMPAGTGKSRLIDSLFEVEGDYDTRHCAFIRLDERVVDFDTLAQLFSSSLGHHLPDDADPFEYISNAVRNLPEHVIIVVDDLHLLHGQAEPLQFIAALINASGVYDTVASRRWLLASRDVEDFPHTIWRADGKCRVLSDGSALALSDAERQAGEELLGLPAQTLSKDNPREIALCYAALRALRTPQIETAAKDRITHFARSHDRHEKAIHDLLTILTPEIAHGILACSPAFEINVDFMVDYIPNIAECVQVLRELDLAFVDLSSGHVRIDARMRETLHSHLRHAPLATMQTAASIACALYCSGADVTLVFDALAGAAHWEAIIELLSRHGIDLLDRHASHNLVSYVISTIPEECTLNRPEIDGLKGLIDARSDVSDKAESWLLCALQNDALVEPLRRNLLYRYCAEIARRGRPDAVENLKKLLDYVYSEGVSDAKIQALAHSLMGAIESGSSPESALSHVERAIKVVADVDDPYTRARVLYDCGFAFKRIGEYERSSSLFREAVEIAVPNDFFAMASRAMANLQELAYEFAHNTPLAIHYLQCMSRYAKKSGDVRAEIHAWLGMYWLAVDSASQDEIDATYSNIVRYSLPDDFMQDQVQRSLVPGAAVISAGNGDFLKAIDLISPYADLGEDRAIRAFRWSELCLYYGAMYAQSGELSFKTNLRHALKKVRGIFAESNETILQEADIISRVFLGLIIIGKTTFPKNHLAYFDMLAPRDHRAHAIANILIELLALQSGHNSPSSFGQALQSLTDFHMGGLSRIIFFLPKLRYKDGTSTLSTTA